MPAKPPLTTVDLFAGCGGLSLGLEQAGFETVFVNELHPDAMGSFLANRPQSDIAAPKNHVHNILEISQDPDGLAALAKRLVKTHGEIGMVVGGPPCQGFSGIGHRRSFDITKSQIPSNHLYREMAKVVSAIAPRAFIFENVKGLLSARWTPDGEKGEIWEDVQATFDAIRVRPKRHELRYVIEPALVHAKDYGVPQNRPRVLMVGIRSDIAPNVPRGPVAKGFLPAPSGGAPGIAELLSDLADPGWVAGGETTTYSSRASSAVQKRLRSLNGVVAKKGAPLTEQEYSKHADRITEKFDYMIANDGAVPSGMETKKFAQRVLPASWGPQGPTITATSLPDDYVHYCQPRILTVREWARLQMFPDWYQFAGKRTTGGRRRAGDPDAGDWSRELPKYTQIGNAVPVALAEAVGRHLRQLIAE
jgi:DNA (cytosine-5)-methyltransferase 1